MLAQKLLAITDEFIQLVQLEKKLLTQRNLKEAGALHGEKDRLNGEYQLAVAQMKADQEYMRSLSDEANEVLFLKTMELKTLLAETGELLAIVSQANSRILSALAEMFSSRPNPVESYNPLGVASNKPKSRTEALTVNTCI